MFRIYKKDVADSEVLEYLPVASGTPTFGMALKQTATGVAPCGATDIPQYICRGVKQTDGSIPVGVVTTSTIYAVPYTAKPAVAGKVTLHTDSLQVTNTTASGVFYVQAVDEENGVAIGRFDGHKTA